NYRGALTGGSPMSRHTRRRLFRPAVEALEARAVPSVCTVDRLNDLDEGKADRGSLRYCVTESLFRADTIDFEVTGTINLMSALPDLTRSVSIEGPGADVLTVRRDSGGSYSIFAVASGATVGISGLTMTNGSGTGAFGRGGGIYNRGTLTVTNS